MILRVAGEHLSPGGPWPGPCLHGIEGHANEARDVLHSADRRDEPGLAVVDVHGGLLLLGSCHLTLTKARERSCPCLDRETDWVVRV